MPIGNAINGLVVFSDTSSLNMLGADTTIINTTGNTNVTLPTSGTLATTTDLAGYLPLTGGVLTGDLFVDVNAPASAATLELFNTATTGPGSDANLTVITRQNGGGDPSILWSIVGSPTVTYYGGIDNTDDTWKFGLGSSVGTSTAFSVNNSTGALSLTVPLALTSGGTNKSLTASNGGIVYTDADSMEILAGTATAGQHLQSGANSAPSWTTATFPATATGTGTILRANGANWVATTATYPTTTTANQLLYSSANNTISEITAAANSVLVTNGSSVPSLSTTLPSAVQNNITAVNSAANTLSIGGSVKTFPSGAVNIPSTAGPTSWTPGIAFGGASVGVTYNVQNGFYDVMTMPNGTQKITAWGVIALSNKGSSTGNVTLTNFPISTGGNGAFYTCAAQQQNISTTSGAQIWISMQNSSSSAVLSYMGNGAALNNVTNTHITNTSVIIFTMIYWTN